jgi:hypothetical protein
MSMKWCGIRVNTGTLLRNVVGDLLPRLTLVRLQLRIRLQVEPMYVRPTSIRPHCSVTALPASEQRPLPVITDTVT